MSWEKETISNALTTIRFPRSCQILSSEIKPFGKYPVIDQGQSFIAGYSDYSEKVISEYLPVIIFGDHTRAVKYVDFPFIIGADGTKVLKPKPDYEAKFFYYALLFIDIPSRGYNRHFSVLKEKVIPKPPLPEQRKIAAILSTVQKAIETENKLIERTRELKKAMMHKLFTEGTRGEKQKMTEIGPVPESWEVKTIGENAQIKGGKRIPKGHKLVDEPTGYPYLRVTDFKNYSIDVSNLKFLLPETQQLIQRYTISDTDVFISIAGTIGICGMVPPNLSGANLTENAAKIVVTNKKIKPRFLMYFLSTDHAQKEIHSQTVKNAQPKLALARIASLRFPIPDLSEQQQIASILSTIDRKIEHHTTKKQKLEELFRTLLHELMTAKIRVNEVELKEVIK